MVAAFIRQSPFFNAPFYGRRLPEDMDPAVHYAVIGEALGWAPSEAFDPQFYLARYSDLEAARVSPLRHFQETGKNEGRRGVPGVQRLTFAPLKDERQPVLVICHEATRTGAPILGWNLIRDLRKNHPVVTLLMRGGVLENDFATASDVVVGPLTDEEWHPAETVAIAERLIKTYQPLYAIANSIETSLMVPPLGALGVPSVALVHEFASYTRPLEKMQGVYDWATHVVFPAQIVANSAFQNFPAFAQRRGIHILAQGRQFPPATRHPASVKRPDIGDLMRSANEKDKFIVLGAGFVHLRKGVDLFLSVAALARRFAPDIRFKFIWVGDGYNPDEDASYSVYLREQISRSGLENIAVFLESVEDFESAYRAADAFFISSRLDPQPNVGIDALTLGLPTVCFAGACGTGEVLASDPETRPLVVPHLDVEAAAREICRVANDPDLRKAMARAVERVGRSAFNSEKYATQIDAWGREAAAALSRLDLETLRSSGAVEPEFALPPRTSLAKSTSVEQVVLLQSTVVGTSPNQYRNAYFRRAIPGFHAQAYAIAHLEDCGPGGQDPTAHWLRHGRPDGPWSHPVYSPKNRPTELRETPRVALHAHFYYADLAPEFAERLKKNRTPCDLFVSTDTEQKAEMLWLAFNEHRGRVTVRVMPNVGRDIGPLLTGFCEEIGSGRYDIWGHAHGKKSAWSNTGIGDRYRTFLWDNLIGGDYPMLDIAIAAFASDSKLGLVFAEDPHLVGWDGNRENAETLAERMGLSRELPEFFDFPLGQMFWFRPAALRRLFELGLKWDDYPKEPVPYDGTLVHALERIVPFVVTSESYGLASLRAPHTTW
jgi:glycosyltransferase involved in cell wall biosynthesis